MTQTNTVRETRELVERYHAAWANEELTAFPDVLAADFSGILDE